MGTERNKTARGGIGEALADPVPQQARLFNFDAQGVRVVGTPEFPWFVAKDVCASLGLFDTSSLRDLEDDEKGKEIVLTLGGPQELLTVNESGLYALIFRSRKPSARLFRRWVTNEVLPSIRKTGSYGRPVADPEIRFAPAWLLAQPAGFGRLALLPTLSGVPREDLETEHFALLLNAAIGDSAPNWSGTIRELAGLAMRDKLFFWRLRDDGNPQHRANLALAFVRRLGVDYCGFGQSHLRLLVVGRGRARRYVIERREGELGGES